MRKERWAFLSMYCRGKCYLRWKESWAESNGRWPPPRHRKPLPPPSPPSPPGSSPPTSSPSSPRRGPPSRHSRPVSWTVSWAWSQTRHRSPWGRGGAPGGPGTSLCPGLSSQGTGSRCTPWPPSGTSASGRRRCCCEQWESSSLGLASSYRGDLPHLRLARRAIGHRRHGSAPRRPRCGLPSSAPEPQLALMAPPRWHRRFSAGHNSARRPYCGNPNWPGLISEEFAGLVYGKWTMDQDWFRRNSDEIYWVYERIGGLVMQFYRRVGATDNSLVIN